ncbi:hypothetical protein [Occallatibacter savannae]|uniref:hypothetical protein n=1 Tax=Occallatibacter savannae TaxID=1002691 RepID=UPI0013A5B419|nr:hypothetical protein [Occallatibacter savannae]
MPMPRKIRIATCLIAMGMASGLVAFRSTPAPPAPAPVAEPAAPALELKPAPSTPIAEKKAELGDDDTWRPEWDATIEKALPEELVSPKMGHKVAQFCPRFSRMSEADRRAFWAYFFQALAGAEAGLHATADVQHTEAQVAVVDGVSHRMVRASGLLQLTYEDSRRYGCDFDWHADKHLPPHDPRKTILQPDNNLLCGVSILDNQLIDQKKPLISVSSYWSTLRPGWPGNKVFIEQMRNVPSACGRPRLVVPKRPAPPQSSNTTETGD